MARRHEAVVGPAQAGLRIDQAMAQLIDGLSRTRAKALLAAGSVSLDKKRVKVAGRIVQAGQRLVVFDSDELVSQAAGNVLLPLPVVSLTPDYVVVNKPSGMFSAPTPESDRGDVLDVLKRHLQEQGQAADLFLVHRLDRPTSGLMVVARNRSWAAHLSAQVADHSAGREYFAILSGQLKENIAVREPIEGRDAVTHFEPIEERAGLSLVRARLETGRTHQVRLHALELGMPVLGDSKYGRQEQRRALSGLARAPRLALHATRLCFLDLSGKSIEFESPLPEDLDAYFQAVSAPSQEP